MSHGIIENMYPICYNGVEKNNRGENMKKIIVIGCPGSGKTTLSIELAKRLNLPLVHLDSLRWRDNWVPVAREEFDKAVVAAMEKPEWIIDGNYNRTIPLRLSYCDTVVFLDFPTVVSFGSAVKRLATGYGKNRPEFGGECPQRVDPKFFDFILKFNRKHRRKYYELFKKYPNVEVIALKNRKQVSAFLDSL